MKSTLALAWISAGVAACAHPSPAREAPAPAAPPPETPAAQVVAVFDVDDGTAKLTAEERRQLASYLAARLATIPSLKVVPRDQLREAVARAKADSYNECFDQSCQIELGKALSAQKSLATRLLQVGSRCAITAELFDLKSETTDKAASAQTACAADALFGAVDQLVHQLGGPPPSAPAAPLAAEERLAARPEPEAPPLELRLDESPASPPSQAPPAEAPYAPRLQPRAGARYLVLPAPVVFARDQDTLSADARRTLERVAQAILADPALRALPLEVVGHADRDERGKLELSERRARNARAHLLSRGLKLPQLGIVARSSDEPSGKANRRVEIRVAVDE